MFPSPQSKPSPVRTPPNRATKFPEEHALAVLTEWDEFRSLDFAKIHTGMHKPAFVFDGRNILPRAALESLGFKVFAIGKPRDA